MIITLVGRRIDEKGKSPPIFPSDNIGRVKEKIREVFIRLNASTLICSGACGADLLDLEVAGEFGIHSTMVLPFEKEEFKRQSVEDRAGGWAEIFDKVYNELDES